jgi:dTMP kinase
VGDASGTSAAGRAQRRPGPSSETVAAIRATVFVLSLAPLARLVLAGTHGLFGGLGANPVELITRSTGTWALVFLCASLAVTPLRRLAGAPWLVRLRRMLGLFAFFYAALHVVAYLWFEHWFALDAMLADVIDRPFITMGFLAFVLMAPLAATSNDATMRRLGRAWGRLHRLVYAIAIAAVLHYWWHKAGKNDYSEVGWYAAAVTLLLGWRVFDRLRARDLDVVQTREPGGSPGAEDIRAIALNGDAGRWSPVTETLLMFAARSDHLERTIRPALEAGRWVVCDRFADSSRAYQGVGGGTPAAFIESLDAAIVGATQPDLTLIFDLPVEVGLERAFGRGLFETRFESKGLEFHERLRRGFLDIAARFPGRCVIIDADGDQDTVAARVWAAVEARLP